MGASRAEVRAPDDVDLAVDHGSLDRLARREQRDQHALTHGPGRRGHPVVESLGEPFPQALDHRVGVEHAGLGHEHAAVGVALAPHRRTFGKPVQRVLDQQLERGVLLLDDHDLGEPAGEPAHDLGIERDRHPHVQEADARGGDLVVGREPEPPEGVAELVVRVAGRDEADPRVAGIDARMVQPVGLGVAADQLAADEPEVVFQLQGPRRQEAGVGVVDVVAPVRAAGRHKVGNGGNHSPGGQVDGGRAVGNRRHDLHRRPRSGEPRQGDGVEPEIEDLLHVARIEDRHVEVDEGGVGAGGERRTLRRGVIADERHGAAMARRPSERGVAERVAGAVEPWRLAVPDAHDTVVAGVGLLGRELASHHRGRAQLLVHSGAAHDGQVGNQSSRPGHLLVEPAQRRTLVTRHERGRVQAGVAVHPELFDGEPGQRLHPAHERSAAAQPVPVGEGVRRCRRSLGGTIDEGHV